ncbi:MAG TPA: LamG domain-containing protein [Solirubrobacteraceae bacterium]|nr:LamG domain-containing protein [Solirubrobacteraceae bacterium]
MGIWSFNEGTGSVAHDTSLPPQHDNGTIAAGTTWTKGRFWNALSFDGNAAGVDVPNENGLQGSEVTVSAWVNNATAPGPFKYIMSKGAQGCLAASYGLYTGPNGGLEFYVASNGGLNWTQSPDAGTGVWNGSWHNVIGTFDGSTVRLYVDGREVGSGTPDTSPIPYNLSDGNDLEIGNYSGCSGLGFSGKIDEVKAFNRVLGAQEIHLAVATSNLLPTNFPDDLVL